MSLQTEWTTERLSTLVTHTYTVSLMYRFCVSIEIAPAREWFQAYGASRLFFTTCTHVFVHVAIPTELFAAFWALHHLPDPMHVLLMADQHPFVTKCRTAHVAFVWLLVLMNLSPMAHDIALDN